jgi:hypothetical protein
LKKAPALLRGNGDLRALRGHPEFEKLAAEEWLEAATFYGQFCEEKPNRAVCALHAVALHLSGREEEARESADRAAALEATEWGCQTLAWYHGCARNRDEAIRYMQCLAEFKGGEAIAYLLDHLDYEWIRGDPEFEAIFKTDGDGSDEETSAGS